MKDFLKRAVNKSSTRFRILFKNYDNRSLNCSYSDPLKTELIPSGHRLSFNCIALALLGALFFVSSVNAAPTVTGTKGAVYPLNNDNSARPGDTITYTISVGNTAATGVANDASSV